jgi:hypothetical protein
MTYISLKALCEPDKLTLQIDLKIKIKEEKKYEKND